jgi:hypothetical protein
MSSSLTHTSELKVDSKKKRKGLSLDEMLTQLLGEKQHMSRTAKQFLAQIRSDAQNTITVRLDCACEVFPHPADFHSRRP